MARPYSGVALTLTLSRGIGAITCQSQIHIELTRVLRCKGAVYGLNGLRLGLYVSSLYHSLRAFPWRQSPSAQK